MTPTWIASFQAANGEAYQTDDNPRGWVPDLSRLGYSAWLSEWTAKLPPGVGVMIDRALGFETEAYPVDEFKGRTEYGWVTPCDHASTRDILNICRAVQHVNRHQARPFYAFVGAPARINSSFYAEICGAAMLHLAGVTPIYDTGGVASFNSHAGEVFARLSELTIPFGLEPSAPVPALSPFIVSTHDVWTARRDDPTMTKTSHVWCVDLHIPTRIAHAREASAAGLTPIVALRGLTKNHIKALTLSAAARKETRR